MNEQEKKIAEYIRENNLSAEHLCFEVSCHSVDEAAQAVGATADDLVKNLCLLGPGGELAVAIVRGIDRLCTKKAAGVLGLKKTRMANPDEILARTGFPCGGTPSFGFSAIFLIDSKVMEMPVIYTGGGSVTSLVKTTPQILISANHAIIADITK